MKKTIEISMYRITRLLHETNWSQAELARKLGVSQQTVQQWVSGKSTPKPGNLDKLTEVTGYPPYWFILPPDEEGVDIPMKAMTSKQKKVLKLLDDLPESDTDQIIRDMEQRTDFYRRKVEELLREKHKPA